MRFWKKKPEEPFRWWLFYCDYVFRFRVERARKQPDIFGSRLVDGPFDTQEDIARALAFWKAQKLNEVFPPKTARQQ